jgi:hypothetical protein
VRPIFSSTIFEILNIHSPFPFFTKRQGHERVLIMLISIYLSIYLSMALQPFVGSWPLSQFLDLLHSLKGSLDEWPASR